MNYIVKNFELGKSTFFSYARGKTDKTPTIKFSDLIKLSQMNTDQTLECQMSEPDSIFENNPLNRFRTAVIKVKNLKKQTYF